MLFYEALLVSGEALIWRSSGLSMIATPMNGGWISEVRWRLETVKDKPIETARVTIERARNGVILFDHQPCCSPVRYAYWQIEPSGGRVIGDRELWEEFEPCAVG